MFDYIRLARAVIKMSVTLILLASIQFSNAGCNELLTSQFTKQNSEDLLAAGFSNSVSMRILESRADIGKEIIRRQKMGDIGGQAITLYRGLILDPQELLTQGKDIPTDILANSILFFSPDLKVAVGYTDGYADFDSPNFQKIVKQLESLHSVTILECELPKYLGTPGIPLPTGGYHEMTFTTASLPDINPFIERVGIINIKNKGPILDPTGHKIITNRWNENDIIWFRYEDIFKNGVPINPLEITK